MPGDLDALSSPPILWRGNLVLGAMTLMMANRLVLAANSFRVRGWMGVLLLLMSFVMQEATNNRPPLSMMLDVNTEADQAT